MENKKGMTLTSIVIYVVIMFIVVGIVGTITGFFYTKTQELEESASGLSEYNKFNAQFVKEVKKEGNSIKTINKSQIVFANGTTFTFAGDGIYRNKVKICTSVKKCEFSSYNQEEKVIISVYLEIGNDFAKKIEYVG